jgi:hypothetical protein
MPIIRSSRVLKRRLLPVVHGALVYRLSVWCGAVDYMSGLRDAALVVHNEELNDLYSSLNITRVIKSRRMRWVGHVVRTGRGEVYTGFWWENLWESGHLKDPDVDGIILRWIFRRWDGGTNWIDLAQERGR